MEALPLCTGGLPKAEKIMSCMKDSYKSPIPAKVTPKRQKKRPIVVQSNQDLKRSSRITCHNTGPSASISACTPKSRLRRLSKDTSEEEWDSDTGTVITTTPVPTSTPESASTPAPIPFPAPTPGHRPSTPTPGSGSRRSRRTRSPEIHQGQISGNLRHKSKRHRQVALAIEKLKESNEENLEESNESIIKVFAYDFPAEMYNGTNVDPSLEYDYLTVFTPAGTQIVGSNPSIAKMVYATNGTDILPSDQEEDGNVDYCLICNESGGIICCDKCPRGFHDTCLEIEGEELPDSWECPRCTIDETEQEDDIKTGDSQTYRMVFKACKKFADDGDFPEKVECLTKIHEIVTYLMDYDFGHIFSEPVDLNTLPDYKKTVKRPMDLGTICANLLKSTYYKKVKNDFENQSQMDMIILDVLKDIEIVWHNCFLYNYEGAYNFSCVVSGPFCSSSHITCCLLLHSSFCRISHGRSSAKKV